MNFDSLKRFGFFDSIPEEDAVSFLKGRIGMIEGEQRSSVLEYLRNGDRFALIAGVARDVLDEARPVIGTRHVLSDGEWLWTEDVAYYVERYGVAPPDELLNLILNANRH